jgi:hypothetical protein
MNSAIYHSDFIDPDSFSPYSFSPSARSAAPGSAATTTTEDLCRLRYPPRPSLPVVPTFTGVHTVRQEVTSLRALNSGSPASNPESEASRQPQDQVAQTSILYTVPGTPANSENGRSERAYQKQYTRSAPNPTNVWSWRRKR